MPLESALAGAGFRLLLVVFLLILPLHSNADDLDLIRETVRSAFSRITSLHVVTRLLNGNFDSISGEIPAYDYEWAFSSDGKIRRAFTQRFLPSTSGELNPYTDIVVYNGDVGLAVTFDKTGENQTSGSILTEEQIYEFLVEHPPHGGEFGRAMGWRINGRSLPEWLEDSTARLMESQTIQNDECDVVLVSDKYQFYLSKNKSYALKRFETVGYDGEVSFTVEIDEFSEVEPGFWLPLRGMVDAHGRPKLDQSASVPYSWEVRQLEINKPLSPELFEIEFTDGLWVIDYRLKELTHWNIGALGEFERDTSVSADLFSEPDRAAGPDSSDAQARPDLPLVADTPALESDWKRTAGLAIVGLSIVLLVFQISRRRKRDGQNK